eukprot:2641112-Rhodomonas_salina.1
MDEVVAKYPSAFNRLLETLDDEVAGLDEASMAAMPDALLRFMEAGEGAGAKTVGGAQYPGPLNRLLEKLDDEVAVDGAGPASSERGLSFPPSGTASASVSSMPVEARIPAGLRMYLDVLNVEEGELLAAAQPLL